MAWVKPLQTETYYVEKFIAEMTGQATVPIGDSIFSTRDTAVRPPESLIRSFGVSERHRLPQRAFVALDTSASSRNPKQILP